MADRNSISKLFFTAVMLLIISLPGCGKAADRVIASEEEEFISSAPRTILGGITFADPVIEAGTRELLNLPEGEITLDAVLKITDFSIQRGESVSTLEDLKWFQNLESLTLIDCGIESLDGIQDLTGLRKLLVRFNRITSIEPVSELVNLADFDCARNPVTDYKALRGLVKMERLCIGDNNGNFTDLSPLENMKQLKELYAPWCGISDISVLSGLAELEYLQLFHNNISDISALSNLKKLTYLQLGLNQITYIEPLSDLTCLEYVNLQSNPIPEEALAEFYAPKEEDYFVTTIHAKIRDDMPEFIFDIFAYLDRSTEVYHAETLAISDGAVFQTISLPELSLFGQTNIWSSMKDTMGFELEDVNFDGYQDIRLFDTTNGNYRLEWIYLVWNPEKELFENDGRLNHISLATFDQEKKLIYGMERGSAVDHSYFTYQYIDGEPVLIQKDTEEGVYREEGQIREYLSMGSVETDVTMFMMFHVASSERNPDTGEMETIKEEYVIYPASDIISEGMELLRVDVSSEIGQAIFQH